MKTDTWMPLFIGDYLADTSHLSTAEHGGYFLLLMHEWRTGPLPNDDMQLRRITKMDADAWSIAQATLREFFVVGEDGKLRQPRLEREKAQALENREKASQKAKKAGNARWHKDAPSIDMDAPGIPRAMLEQCPSPSPLPLRTKTTTTGAEAPKRGVDLGAAYAQSPPPKPKLVKLPEAAISEAEVESIRLALPRPEERSSQRQESHPRTAFPTLPREGDDSGRKDSSEDELRRGC